MRKESSIDKIKESIRRVNKTLKHFESNYVSAKRLPGLEKERCLEFEHYLEIRFNFEMAKVEFLTEHCEEAKGKLFELAYLNGFDKKTNRFKEAGVMISKEALKKLPKRTIREIKEYIGGDFIKFNSVNEKVKVIITDNNKKDA